VLSLPTIEKIIFSTKDERLTNEIKHLGLTVEYQAYNFVMKNEVTTNFKMKLATMDEYEVIHKTFTELPFMDYKIKIPNKEVYISYDEQGNLISIGILDPMLLPENRVCVGMEVVKSQRNNGYGTKTIEFLVQLLQQQQIGINARCYYYNHPSKKTLLKSGFEVSNLLLRVESLISIDSDSNSQADY